MRVILLVELGHPGPGLRMLLEIPPGILGLAGTVLLTRPILSKLLREPFVILRQGPEPVDPLYECIVCFGMLGQILQLEVRHLLPDFLGGLEIIATGLKVEADFGTIGSQLFNVPPFSSIQFIEGEHFQNPYGVIHRTDLIIHTDAA